MKNVILLASVLLFSCKKQITFQSEGTLTGVDYALCPCCGGVILKIGTDINNRIDSLPGMTNQEFFSLNFPKTIRFNSVLKSTCGSFNYLTITSYKITD